MALDRLLSLPDKQRMEAAGASLLLWGEDEEVDEEAGEMGGENGSEREGLVTTGGRDTSGTTDTALVVDTRGERGETEERDNERRKRMRRKCQRRKTLCQLKEKARGGAGGRWTVRLGRTE